MVNPPHARPRTDSPARSAPDSAPRLAAVLLCLSLAAACGQLPRPFQPEDKSSNDLLYLADRSGILVRPVGRDAPGDPAAAAELLAAALRARNLAASTRDANGTGQILRGWATVQRLPSGRDEVLLSWELAEATGALVGRTAQRSELSAGAWQTGDPATLDRMMDRAAEAVAALVQDPAVERPGLAGFAGARLVILPMRDLPGDGALSLPRALGHELDAARLPLADRAGGGDLLVACTVSLGPPREHLQEVRITWTVTRAGDGLELGRIDQQNRIPAGSLDGPWGPAAHGIAQGAVQGIRALVERLDRRA
ncbi:MAG: hypothetical protein OEU09_00295 [Rhodospirillales bacterium]|nr:hypothetical protein [Rhodospirillales bacterium]MDH3909701.1 hypothetical protein [Rhodospirillales bacterium]MDH3916665.1 hypothetical protein [Rhodospirillales bacterium]